MKENNWMQKEKHTEFLGSIQNEVDIDDKTFKLWMFELQKELLPFWESMVS
ncbi:MAG: hypothetical protein JSW60_00680 [Thermoplasmatales archaeon]|nr:MAG: hypothetical protein JSW60_00680 [Thermoplasmatales archaeon]